MYDFIMFICVVVYCYFLHVLRRYICQAMFLLVEMMLRRGGVTADGRVIQVHDLSFKLTVCEFGLALVALPFKSFDGRVWRTSEIYLSLGWGPKDDDASWSVILISIIMFYKEQGIDLWKYLGPGMWDATAGGRLAHLRLYGPVRGYWRCLRHQIAGLLKLPSRLGGRVWGQYVAGNVHFVSALATKPLFSLYVNAYISELMKDKPELVGYLTGPGDVFRWNAEEKSWEADWACGPWTGLPAGLTPDTISQGMESSFDAIKDAISVSVHHRDIAYATQKVEHAVNAVLVNRGYVAPRSDPQHNGEWQMQEMVHGRSWLNMRPTFPAPLLLSAEGETTERLRWQEGQQRRVPGVRSFLEHAPSTSV